MVLLGLGAEEASVMVGQHADLDALELAHQLHCRVAGGPVDVDLIALESLEGLAASLSAKIPRWASKESASGWICTVETSVPSSEA